jgi:hypothetical protein
MFFLKSVRKLFLVRLSLLRYISVITQHVQIYLLKQIYNYTNIKVVGQMSERGIFRLPNEVRHRFIFAA